MKYSWITNKQADVIRILGGCVNIANNFYQNKRFLVLPTLVEENSCSVYIPELDYNSIPDFWSRVPKAFDKQGKLDQALLDETLALLNEYSVSKELIKIRKREFNSVIKKVEATLKSIFELDDLIETAGVVIYVSMYRTGCSFHIEKVGEKYKMYIQYRPDTPISSVIEAIVSNLVKLSYGTNSRWQQVDWEMKEGIVDFIIGGTKVANYLEPDYCGTLSSIKKLENNADLAEQSKQYLKRLGFPIEPIFSTADGKVYMNNKRPLVRFTKTEEKILKCMIDNKSRIVSFDTVGDLIWNQDQPEKYSLWAISKFIQRIREKINQNGVKANVLMTKRGFGYLLYD